MEIKIVNRPAQDYLTRVELIQYNTNEYWCVKTHMFREKDGGMKLWFKHITDMENKGCTVLYLYDIHSEIMKIDSEDELVYIVRADYKIYTV